MTTNEAPKTNKKLPTSFAKSLLLMLFLTASVFLCAWLWLTSQLESLLQHKVEETGRQLTQVAAIASAEAVIAEDTVFLKKLTSELVKEAFINKVSVYRIDGTLIIESTTDKTDTAPKQEQKPESTELATESDEQNLKDWLTAHLPQYFNDNYPFMVEINWESTSVGWFEIIINRKELEHSIRDSSYKITLIAIIGFLISLFLGLFIVWRRHLALKTFVKELKQNDQSVSDSAIHSLDEAASSIKNNDERSKDLHFKSASLKGRQPGDSPSRDFKGCVQLFRIGVNDDTPFKTKLDAIKKWQELIFDASSQYGLEATIVRDQQILVTVSREQLASALKLALLIYQIQQKLANNSSITGHCFMRMGEEKVVLKKVNPFYCLIEGDSFKEFESSLSQQKQFAWISKNIAEIIPRGQQKDDILSSGFSLDGFPDETIKIKLESVALIERQAERLANKSWPKLSEESS
ncbi:hypothetical protein [Pleionea sediminis]|uniref:hypothetical protein n=1 Tax=Pleionea sediminis TaxID=2569479 RepID=UPI001184D1D0|nr:hypothetical protein [Pleionea sediminis]